MSHETEKQKVKEFVKQWMDGHEPNTFVKNKHDAFMYSAEHSSLNLVLFFESLLEDYIDETIEAQSQPSIVGDVSGCRFFHDNALDGLCKIHK